MRGMGASIFQINDKNRHDSSLTWKIFGSINEQLNTFIGQHITPPKNH